MPENVCDQQTFLLMIVCSAPANSDARSAIRKTWGKTQKVHQQKVTAYFLVGETVNSSIQVRYLFYLILRVLLLILNIQIISLFYILIYNNF